MQARLSELSDATRVRAASITVGRYIQALTLGDGHHGAIAHVEKQHMWADRSMLLAALNKSAQGAHATTDFALTTGGGGLADSFMQVVRETSVPARLPGLQRVPLMTRLYINTTGVVASKVVEGAPIPVLRGTWNASTTLAPIKVGAIVVQTVELVQSPSPNAAEAIGSGLGSATGEALNFSFLNPNDSASILFGATPIASSGATVTNIDSDLATLAGSFSAAALPGCVWLMTPHSALALSLKRLSDGAPAYPGMGATGGMLCGLPVLTTGAMQEVGSPNAKYVALVNPQRVYFGEGWNEVLASQDAALQLSDAPGSGATTLTSCFATNSVATRAVLAAGWKAASDAAVYMVASF